MQAAIGLVGILFSAGPAQAYFRPTRSCASVAAAVARTISSRELSPDRTLAILRQGQTEAWLLRTAYKLNTNYEPGSEFIDMPPSVAKIWEDRELAAQDPHELTQRMAKAMQEDLRKIGVESRLADPIADDQEPLRTFLIVQPPAEDAPRPAHWLVEQASFHARHQMGGVGFAFEPVNGVRSQNFDLPRLTAEGLVEAAHVTALPLTALVAPSGPTPGAGHELTHAQFGRQTWIPLGDEAQPELRRPLRSRIMRSGPAPALPPSVAFATDKEAEVRQRMTRAYGTRHAMDEQDAYLGQFRASIKRTAALLAVLYGQRERIPDFDPTAVQMFRAHLDLVQREIYYLEGHYHTVRHFQDWNIPLLKLALEDASQNRLRVHGQDVAHAWVKLSNGDLLGVPVLHLQPIQSEPPDLAAFYKARFEFLFKNSLDRFTRQSAEVEKDFRAHDGLFAAIQQAERTLTEQLDARERELIAAEATR
jgi:hypothetical protein